MDSDATILHADLDAFYASVEQLLDPSLRGKPIAVGGGVVLAASYEAKAFGVRGGMPGRRARELCPELIFVGGHFKEYQRLGDAAMQVLGDFTPLVERISIDEAFADVAGCTHLFGSPAEIARSDPAHACARSSACRSRSAWRAPSTWRRSPRRWPSPTGWSWSIPATELEFLHDLPVELMWGVGPVTKARLAGIGVHDHRPAGRDAGHGRSSGCSVRRRARSSRRWPGTAIRARSGRTAAPHSAGAQSALGRKPAEEHVFRPTLRHLADRVGAPAAGQVAAGPHRDGARPLRRPALGDALA